MQIRTTRSGMIYLRGQAYDRYEGTAWSVSNVDTTQDHYWPTKNMQVDGEITIKTRTNGSLRYLPYYPQNGQWLDQIRYGRLEGEPIKEYTYSLMTRTGWNNLAGTVVRDALVSQCLELPESTKTQAKAIVKTLSMGPTYSASQRASVIAEYVRNLMPYDTKTAAMPLGTEDFALWVLTEAESGYCVHFATAATVLLRAAGVPARYVSGYMVEVTDGYAVVEQRHAHAWVEYLDDTQGWVVLDPTPSVASDDPTEPTDPSNPDQTTRPTETTEPTESTEPNVTTSTEPTTGTEPTITTGPAPTESEGVPQTRTEQDWRWLWEVLGWVTWCLAIVALIGGQYWLRITWRDRKRRKASVNDRALQDWRQIHRLSRLLHQPIPEQLEELAEKAMFSQHTLTEQECRQFLDQLAQLRQIVQKQNWIYRSILRLIFVIG